MACGNFGINFKTKFPRKLPLIRDIINFVKQEAKFSNFEVRLTNVKMAIIFFIIVKANKNWYFSTHLAYLFETAYWLLAYSWIFRWEISQSWCNSMSYDIFTNFKFFCDTSCPVFVTFFKAFFFLTQLFNNFFFFSVRKIRLHSWYHLRRFCRTLGIFGDGRHFEFSLQLCCLFVFDHLRQTWRARRFKYSNTVVKESVDEKKGWNCCIAKQFGMHIVAEIHSLQWKWSHFLPHLLARVVGMFIKSWHGKIQGKMKH